MHVHPHVHTMIKRIYINAPGSVLDQNLRVCPVNTDLQNLALGPLVKEQSLLVKGIASLLGHLCLFLGYTCSVLQQVSLDIGG